MFKSVHAFVLVLSTFLILTSQKAAAETSPGGIVAFSENGYLQAYNKSGTHIIDGFYGFTDLQVSHTVVAFRYQNYLYVYNSNGAELLAGYYGFYDLRVSGNIISWIHDGYLYAMDSNGNLIFSGAYGATNIMVSENIIAFKYNGYLYAYSSNGSQIISGYYGATVLSMSSKMIAFRYGGDLYVYRTDGAEVLSGYYNATDVVVSTNLIAFRYNNYLYVFNSNGQELISSYYGFTGLQVSTNMVSFFYNGYLYAFNLLGTELISGYYGAELVQLGANIIAFRYNGYLYAFNSMGSAIINGSYYNFNTLRVAANIMSFIQSGYIYAFNTQGTRVVYEYGATFPVIGGDILGFIDGSYAYAYRNTGASIIPASYRVTGMQIGHSQETLLPGPSDITSLTATALSTSSIRLNWSSAGTNAKYRVKAAPGGTAPLDCSGGTQTTSTTMTFSGLNTFSQHSYRVCVEDSFGQMSAGVTVSRYTLDNPAQDPANFVAVGVGISQVKLTWDYSGINLGGGFVINAAEGILPEANCNSGSNHALSARTATIGGLKVGTTYTFRLCAYNGNLVRPVGNGLIATATTLDASYTPPPNPKRINSIATSGTSISISWQSGGTGTSYYRISHLAGDIAPADCSVGTDVFGLSTVVTGLNPWTKYSFRLCAVSSKPVPSTGVTFSTKTLDADPVNVTNLHVSAITKGSVRLAWDYSGPNQEGGFLIKVQKGAAPPANCSKGISVGYNRRDALVEKLSRSTLYTFRVCAFNSNSKSASGVVISATTSAN